MPSPKPLYRTRQFLGALRPRMSAEEREEAAALLGGRLLPLFDGMSPRDRRHCLDVYLALRRRGCQEEDVLLAALLHDAGKGGGVRLWQRVAYVLLAASPRLLERLADRWGLAALHRHAERGAELAAGAGAPPAVVELIRRHEERDAADERAALLRAADDSC